MCVPPKKNKSKQTNKKKISLQANKMAREDSHEQKKAKKFANRKTVVCHINQCDERERESFE
jgi:hypothetical protein